MSGHESCSQPNYACEEGSSRQVQPLLANSSHSYLTAVHCQAVPGTLSRPSAVALETAKRNALRASFKHASRITTS